MVKSKPMINIRMFKEWDAINSSNEEIVKWQFHCRSSEPGLFLGHWEDWIRTVLNPLVREIAPAVAMNGSCIRTIESLLDRAMLMGYFFGVRRFQSDIESIDPTLGKMDKSLEEDPPDTGGFNARDFLL